MGEKHLVCQGAICECKYGSTPDQLVVKSQKKHFINDEQGSEKLLGNTMDIGQPFMAKTFGSCKMMDNKPCKPAVTEWTAFYKNVVLDNGGQILLENSKGTCAIAGNPCIEFTFHGQTAAMSNENKKKADQDISSYMNPMINMKELEDTFIRFDLPGSEEI